MNRLFKLLTLGIICSAVFSTSVYAESLTCTMENDRKVTAEITFHEFGFIDEIRVKSTVSDEILFKSENDMRVITYGITASDIKNNSFIAGMKMKAKLKNENYKDVDFQAIIPKNRTDGELQEVTDYMSDDGAGFGLLRFKDSNYKLVGASLFLGWAGVYNNCK